MIVSLHSYIAFLALSVVLLAFVNALNGFLTGREFQQKRDRSLSLAGVAFFHLQFLIGLVVYFVSAKGFYALSEVGIGNLSSEARLLALEHPTTNLIAVALVTIGWSRHKRALESKAKFKSIALFYGIGLILILSSVSFSCHNMIKYKLKK